MNNHSVDEATKQLERVIEIAYGIFGDELLVAEWMSSPNHLFFGQSPIEMILGGRWDGVLSALEDFGAPPIIFLGTLDIWWVYGKIKWVGSF